MLLALAPKWSEQYLANRIRNTRTAIPNPDGYAIICNRQRHVHPAATATSFSRLATMQQHIADRAIKLLRHLAGVHTYVGTTRFGMRQDPRHSTIMIFFNDDEADDLSWPNATTPEQAPLRCPLVLSNQQQSFALYLEGKSGQGLPRSLADRPLGEFMAALIEAINVKRKSLFEFENIPFACLDSEISSPTARGGQTLVRLKMRNLLTNAVFEKTFKANDKFKDPDLVLVPASYLYSDNDGSHFLDQETFETLTLNDEMTGDALGYLIEGALLQLHKYNGNPIGLQLPMFVELNVAYTEPAVRGDSSSGSVTKSAKLETGLEIRVPLFIKEGEKVKVATETGEFVSRA